MNGSLTSHFYSIGSKKKVNDMRFFYFLVLMVCSVDVRPDINFKKLCKEVFEIAKNEYGILGTFD